MIVLGATSDVSKAFIEKYITEKGIIPALYLCTSHVEETERYAKNIWVKYKQDSKVIPLNVMEEVDYAAFQDVHPKLLFCATGFLGKNSDEGLFNSENTQKIIEINYSKLVPVIQFFAERMKHAQEGTLIGISSVAGERGRQSNFMYGSAKAGFTTYLDGLRNYLYPFNVQVITVLPGFMDTKMTSNIHTPKPLTISPEKAANLIFQAYVNQKNKIYISPIWRYIMFIIKNIPEFIFKKMKM